MRRVSGKAGASSRSLALLLGALAACFVAGCGSIDSKLTEVGTQGSALRGAAYGGLQPVGNATIQLFTPGAAGYASAATPLLKSPAMTDANGNFSITGNYTCPFPQANVYMVITGGNPGLSAGSSNPALALMSLLGPCSNLNASTFLTVNELTTIAAVYAMQPFMTDYAHVGAPMSNQVGIAYAFQTAESLVALNGHAAGTSPAFATIPVVELNTLGDVISSCINTDGTISGMTPCGRLFAAVTPLGSAMPTETIGALLDIARNPSHNVTTIYNLGSAVGPYQPTLTASPPDWTIAINYSLPAFRTPADLAIDSQGAVWVIGSPGTLTNGSSTVSAFTVNGLVGSYPQSTTNFGNMAIDPFDNIWLTDTNRSDVVELTNTGARANFTAFTGGGLQGPGPLAFDPAGNAWIVNNSATVTVLNASGQPLRASAYATGGANGPVAIASDAQGQIWTVNSAGSTVTKLSNTGAPINGSPFTGNGLANPFALAFDSNGQAYVANRGSSTVTVFASTGSPPASATISGAGINAPIAIAVDGANATWVVNSGANTLSVVAAGAQPVTGTAGFASAFLTSPFKLAIDASGDVWVANLGSSVVGSGTITQVVGAAAPVVTPLSLAVKRNVLAQRP